MKTSHYLSPQQISQAIKIIRNAGEILLKYRKQIATIKSEGKNDGTIVTEADFASNDYLTKELSLLNPEFEIYSEELKPKEDSAYQKGVWIIDPLDGTKAFMDGRDDFSILVAFQYGYELLFGMMLFPAKEMLFTAIQGDGAYLNEKVKLSVTATPKLLPTSIYGRVAPEIATPYVYPERIDSGMAFAMVGMGELSKKELAIQLDGAIAKHGALHCYDFAAPTMIIREAGGRVTDEKGADYKFLVPNYNPEFFVASNGLVHDELLRLVGG